MTDRRTHPVLFFVFLLASCNWPWPMDDPNDPWRCEPRCQSGQRCQDGRCVVADLGVDAGKSATCPGFRYPGGWCWHNPLPHGNLLRDLWGTSATNLYAVGKMDTVTRWDGKRWTLASLPVSRQDYYGIWGRNASDIFVVGTRRYVLRNRGSGWSHVRPFPGLSVNFTHFFGVWGSGASDVVVVGQEKTDRGLIARYDGWSWGLEATSLSLQVLNGVHGTGPNNVYAVGNKGEVVHYRGKTAGWKKESLKGVDWLGGVWGVGPTNVIAVGQTGGVGVVAQKAAAWKTGGGGTAAIHSIWSAGPNLVFGGGARGLLCRLVGSSCVSLAPTDTTWTHNRQWDGAWGLGGGRIYFAGQTGEVVRSNGKKEFTGLTTTLSRSTLVDIWGAGPNNIHAVGDRGVVLRWDGSTWTRAVPLSAAENYTAVWGASHTDVFAVAANGTVAHLAGDTWTKQAATGLGLQGIWGSGPTNVWSAGIGGAITHHDGKSWRTLHIKGGSDLVFFGVWVSPGADLVVVVGKKTTTEGGKKVDRPVIYHNDSGKNDLASWKERPVAGVTDPLRDVWGTSATNVWTCGGYAVARFDGKAWSGGTLGTNLRHLYAIWGTGPTEIFITGSHGHVGRSDGGSVTKSWTELGSRPATSQSIFGVWGSGASDLFVVGYGGAILHHRD